MIMHKPRNNPKVKLMHVFISGQFITLLAQDCAGAELIQQTGSGPCNGVPKQHMWCHTFSCSILPPHLLYFSGFSKHRPTRPMLSISRFVRLCVCPSVCLFVCLFTFEVPFNGRFAPTSQSRMSNIFRDSESLGKSNGKKWSQIWSFLFESGLKSLCKKSFFSLTFFTFEVPFNGFFAPTFRSRMSNIFKDIESLGKSNGKKWSNIWTF